MSKYKGLLIPKKGDPDYESARVVHCNSCDSEYCDEMDCDKCLFGEKNLKKFTDWLVEGKKKYKAYEKGCKAYDIDFRDFLDEE